MYKFLLHIYKLPLPLYKFSLPLYKFRLPLYKLPRYICQVNIFKAITSTFIQKSLKNHPSSTQKTAKSENLTFKLLLNILQKIY